MSPDAFFRAIEHRRFQLRMSQADLCRESGYDPRAYSRLRAGDARPDLCTIAALGEALGMTARSYAREVDAWSDGQKWDDGTGWADQGKGMERPSE